MTTISNRIGAALRSVIHAKDRAQQTNGGDRRSCVRRALRIGIILLILGMLVVLFHITVLRPPHVMVAMVRRGNAIAEIEGTGTVTANALAVIAARITGRVEQVFVDEGDTVRKNEILATLDSTGRRLRVAVAQAHLDAARARADELRRDWIRERGLVSSGAVGVQALQRYRERYVVAQSTVRAAKAELEYADYELSLTQIPTLLHGIIIKRWVVPGASVVPGQPMFTVADTRLIYVDAFVDQNSAGEVHKGEPATIMLRGHSRPLQGYVLRIRPRADAATEETVVQVAFRIPANQFQLGQWANVYIQTGEVKDALIVPQTALMSMGNQLFVWTVGADDTVRRVRVVVLARSPRRPAVAIAGPLRAGDRVVLMPMGLRPGEKVHPVAMKTRHTMGAMQ